MRMNIFFDPIESEDVKSFFYDFFHKDGVFFEVISNGLSIGFYGVKIISENFCEISLYIHEKFRDKITKKLALKCFNFPFLLGFTKVLIRTELEKMRRFLLKFKNYGVNYLFNHNDMYLFEVLP
jgi:hypothetical protein